MAKIKPYSGKEPYIFISYAHKNNDLVMPVIERLVADGYRVWYDEGIVPGSEWDEFIAAHLEGCGAMLAMMSPEYMASGNCRDELNFARDLDKPRLLIYLSPVDLPAGMRMRLGRLQAVFKYAYESEDDFYKKLYEAELLVPCLGVAPAAAAVEEQEDAATDEQDDDFSIEEMLAGFDDHPAIWYFQKAAEMGSTDAMLRVGRAYFAGDGVEKDLDAAYTWFKRAADAGDLEGAYAVAAHDVRLVDMLEDSYTLSDEELIYYLTVAAEGGHAEAQYRLYILYDMGVATEREPALAEKWLAKAAENGHATACHAMGIRAYNADDYARAAAFWRTAAEAGEPASMIELADCYLHGHGVAKNTDLSLAWYEKAAALGNDRGAQAIVENAANFALPSETVVKYALIAAQGARKLSRLLQKPEMEDAIKWYRIAAEHGSEEAEEILKKHVPQEGAETLIRRGDELF